VIANGAHDPQGEAGFYCCVVTTSGSGNDLELKLITQSKDVSWNFELPYR
jgi:hypothetical protein